MPLKAKNIINILVKVSILSSIIFGIIYFGYNFLYTPDIGNNEVEKSNNSNELNFKNTKIEPIANVGIAISTNLGIKYTRKDRITTSNIYSQIFSADEILLNNTKVKEELLGKNMIFTREYLNFVTTDFNNILKTSTNKKKTVENIINQLEIRFTESLKNVSYLVEQNTILIEKYTSITADLTSIKQSLQTNFNNTDTQNIYINIDAYYKLKNDETKIKLYIIFINNLLNRYNSINAYNKLLLDTLINNKDVISKNSFVVIPDSGDELIDDFGLIISETEYKAQNQEQ